jgi:hypothetical protein
METWWDGYGSQDDMPNPADYFGAQPWGAAEAVLSGAEVYWDAELSIWTDGENDLSEYGYGEYTYGWPDADEQVDVAVEEWITAGHAAAVGEVTEPVQVAPERPTIFTKPVEPVRVAGYDKEVYRGVIHDTSPGATECLEGQRWTRTTGASNQLQRPDDRSRTRKDGLRRRRSCC